MRAQTVSPEAVELLGLPGLDGLTDDQVRGADCVWCRTGLSIETAVDLGELQSPLAGTTSEHGTRWFPRADRRCIAPRARRALDSHTPMCEQCADERAICPVGRILQQLAKEQR
ncbi:hypothetical protein [Streptomyces sp. CRN 30]|uniref:hypothetical protein n=1 Tax=Streptomyces sp. CRN 30 TaxID=3075613 RepID=UPI002A822526|nr:hypothetical protein [Streptomyces sp. CRN 30]